MKTEKTPANTLAKTPVKTPVKTENFPVEPENAPVKTEPVPEVRTEVAEIGRYGAAVLKVTAAEFFAAGFCPGDLVEIRLAGKMLVMPVGTSYTDVDNGKLILVKIELEERMILSISYGNGFAEEYGIRIGTPVGIRMAEKGGYLEEYRKRSLPFGTERSEYPSDEAFVNFRTVRAGRLREGMLWRGFSPINDMENRAHIADRLLRATEVRTVINLDGEEEEERKAYRNYEKTWYSTRRVIPVKMKFSPQDPSFPESMQKIFRAFAASEGAWYIHCRYGRDRTGLVCAVLEGICGASPREITEEFMLSYENIHGVSRGTEKWKDQAELRLFEPFRGMTGLAAFPGVTQEETEEALCRMLTEHCGVSTELIREVREKLCGRAGTEAPEQKTENREQKTETENREQKTENREQKTENRAQKTENSKTQTGRAGTGE